MSFRKAGIVALRYQNGRAEICVVSSNKHKGRWVLPKGTIERGEKPRMAAAREAYEEAGVLGEVAKPPRVLLSRNGRLANKNHAYAVYYPMAVSVAASKWPERKTRKRKWVPLSQISARKKYFRIWRVVRHMMQIDKPAWQRVLKQVRQAPRKRAGQRITAHYVPKKGAKSGLSTDRSAA
ncbi:MAG: NUDIX domain-containing protein [Parvibaculales bacterium]